ncbi:MAG: T9SS type A sorting domain-containing protein, partial [Bacteroidota bacterium]
AMQCPIWWLGVSDSQSNWFGPTRQIISKDENGKVIKALTFWMLEEDEWIPSTRMNVIEDNGTVETQFIENWNDERWQPMFLHTITTKLVADGIETDRITQTDQLGNWINNSRYINRKNADGLELLQLHYDWDGAKWVETYRWENRYNEQGDLIYTEYGSAQTQEISRRRMSYTYNAAGQPLTLKRENAYSEPPDWTLHSEEVFEYDEQGRILLKDRTIHTQNRVRREETEYRGDTILYSLFQAGINEPLRAQSRSWRVPNKIGIGYDTYSRNDRWGNNKWEPLTIVRREINYDRYDNITYLEQLNFENGEWQPVFYQNHLWEYTEEGDPTKKIIVEYNYNTQRQNPVQKQIWRYEDRKERSQRPIIELAPNPAAGPLTISFHSAPALPIRWVILDEAGRVVRAADISEVEQTLGLEVNTEGLQFGLYLLQIQYEDGSTVAKKWQKI